MNLFVLFVYEIIIKRSCPVCKLNIFLNIQRVYYLRNFKWIKLLFIQLNFISAGILGSFYW